MQKEKEKKTNKHMKRDSKLKKINSKNKFRQNKYRKRNKIKEEK